MSVAEFKYWIDVAMSLLQYDFEVLGIMVSVWEILVFLALASILSYLIGGLLR